MPSRRQVLRTTAAAGGVVFTGQVAAQDLGGERLDVQQTETALVTVDRRIADGVPDQPEICTREKYPFAEGSEGRVYVSESDEKPAFDTHDGLAVATSTNKLESERAGGRVSLVDGPQLFHSSAGGIFGEVEPTVALDASERPSKRVRVVGDGVSATVAAGETKTIELTGSFRSTAAGGETVTDRTTVEVTVEHRGVRNLVTHPTATLTPDNIQRGRLAARDYADAGSDGLVSTDAKTFELRYDERGFFAHELVDRQTPSIESPLGSRVDDLDDPPSTEGADTTVLIYGTEKFMDDRATQLLEDMANAFEYRFNGQTNKEVAADWTWQTGSGLDIGSPTDFDDAWNSVDQSSKVEHQLDNEGYDGVMVVDDRSLSGSAGRAYVGTAGTDGGYGYCESPEADTVKHECGHLYGCSHGGSTTHWQRHNNKNTLMGYPGVADSCEGMEPEGWDRYGWYSWCCWTKMQDYVDNNL